MIIDAGQGVARTCHSGTYAQPRIREGGTSDSIQAPDGHLRPEPALDLPTDSQVEVAVTTQALLADSTRLRILWLLGAWVRIPKPRISRTPVVYPGDPNLTMLWSGHLQSDFGPTLLARGDREVGALSALTGATASATSQHPAKFRLAGLVSMRRAGRQHVYIVRGSHVRALVDEALDYADHRVSGEPDHE